VARWVHVICFKFYLLIVAWYVPFLAWRNSADFSWFLYLFVQFFLTHIFPPITLKRWVFSINGDLKLLKYHGISPKTTLKISYNSCHHFYSSYSAYWA
jgi:hypothetical protein